MLLQTEEAVHQESPGLRWSRAVAIIGIVWYMFCFMAEFLFVLDGNRNAAQIVHHTMAPVGGLIAFPAIMTWGICYLLHLRAPTRQEELNESVDDICRRLRRNRLH